MLLGTSGTDVGHTLENIVYPELIRRAYNVYTGKVDELEVDFVARRQKGIRYIQVATNVRDKKSLTRELASLQRISDNYSKVILTLDEDPEVDYEGILRINVLECLVGRARIYEPATKHTDKESKIARCCFKPATRVLPNFIKSGQKFGKSVDEKN